MTYGRLQIANPIHCLGETEWSKIGRFTGSSAEADIGLTPDGEEQVRATANVIVGAGKTIDLSRLRKVYVSPTKRATTTFELLMARLPAFTGMKMPRSGEIVRISLPHADQQSSTARSNPDDVIEVEVSKDILEWDYGDYEGKTEDQIRKNRKEEGLDQQRAWDIWSDGCKGGEYIIPRS